MAADELAQMKEGARATWAAGDYGDVAETIWPVGERLVSRMGITPGEEVLDVACGTGNAAIRAAEAGGQVVGSDLTPELFERGRMVAAEAGVEIDWVEGDAEALPFPDESFDVVISVFGCMFAPRHAVAAQELARVLRRGGRLGVAAWTPDGQIGRFFKAMSGYLPPPPELASPPPLWGDEDHVREIFDGTGVELSFERDSININEPFDGPEEQLEFYLQRFGPLMRAREAAEAEGTWPQLREEILSLYSEDEPAEYLITLGRKS